MQDSGTPQKEDKMENQIEKGCLVNKYNNKMVRDEDLHILVLVV